MDSEQGDHDEYGEQPDELAILVIVKDLGGPENAKGVISKRGRRICMADRTFLDNNPIARENAFRVFMSLADGTA